MIPVGAIVGAAMAAGRRRGPSGPPPERINALFAFVRIALYLLVFLSFGISPALGSVMFVLSVLVWVPSLTLAVLVALGWSRGAYFFTRVCPPWSHARTPRGSGAMYGMLAVLTRSEIDRARVDWLESKIMREPVRGPTLLAYGLMAYAREDRERARELFEIVAPLRAPSTAARVRRVALEWLMADAMQRGDWSAAAKIGAQPTFRWVLAARWMARRIAGAPDAPSDLALRFAWLWAPHRATTLPLLRRALATASGQKQVAVSPLHETADPSGSPVRGVTTIDAALAAHASCLSGQTGATIARAAVAWDAVRNDTSAAALLQRRALALGTQTAQDGALARMLSDAEADLSARCATAGPGPEVPSLTYFIVTSRVRSEQLREVEYLAGAMKKRTIDQRDLTPVDEWLEWVHLRAAADRVLAGADAATKRAIFEVVYLPVCNHAVRLFNVKKQGLIAHTMFRWLLALTKKTENPAAYNLLQKNAKASFVDY